MTRLAKLLVCLAAVMALVALLCPMGVALAAEDSNEEECYLHGDLNADGYVDEEDAILALYYSIFGAEEYPVAQTTLFEGRGLSKDDAIYILRASNPEFSEEYPLQGEIHAYHAPIWVWSADGSEVEVTFSCVCGDDVVFTQRDDAMTVTTETVEATCKNPGSKTFRAELEFNDKTYDSSKVLSLEGVADHTWDQEQDCEHDATCTVCGSVKPALGHEWEQTDHAAASCDEDEKYIYTCSNCGGERTDVQEGTKGCLLHYDPTADQLVEGETCVYQKFYRCSRCNELQAGKDTYVKHDHKVTGVEEATCQADGKITYTCVCGDTKEEALPQDPEAHSWDAGQTDANDASVTVYTCAYCKLTKTTVSAVSGDNQAIPVAPEAITSSKEIEVQSGASVTMDSDTKDQVVSTMEENELKLQITVDKMEGQEKESIEELLTDAQKEQIGENPVYDFNMAYVNAEGEEVESVSSFAGTVTVSLPYTLGEGEDPNDISVWFIADDGTVEEHHGVYSNGAVTFTTDHFSCYTIIRMTPAERCARYGHIEGLKVEKHATCTEDGYARQYCLRCSGIVLETLEQAKGHALERTEPTCTTSGREVCANGCGYIMLLPATGHSMVAVEEESGAATCFAPGQNVHACEHEGCSYKIVEVLPQIRHNYVKAADSCVTADCTTAGFDLYVCEFCKDEQRRNEQAPLGHSYQKVGWTWAKDYSSATLELKCSRCGEVKTLNATVKSIPNTNPCLGGADVYKAEVVYNKVSYSDTQSITVTGGHTVGEDWHQSEDGKLHYHVCTVCQTKIDATAHNWTTSKVVEATCTTAGQRTYTCADCGVTKTETIAATGIHTYALIQSVTADCTTAGFELYKCDCCGEEELRNQQAALGHSYQKVGWTWAEDYSSATLELKCSRCDTVETRNATVKLVSNALPCLGGSTIYKAEVVFNKVSYSDTQSITVPAGHTSDNVWHQSKDGLFHYHLCTVCQSQIDTAAHNWDDGEVTKVPTCSTPGQRSHSCADCGATKTEAIAATGEHTYVDGVCTVCHEKQDCDHEPTVRVDVDMSQYDVCEGSYFYWLNCECGKTKLLGGEFTCKMESSFEGNTETLSCTECKLDIVMEDISIRSTQVECGVERCWKNQLFWDGQLLAEGTSGTTLVEHDVNSNLATFTVVDLSDEQYGLCGVQLEISSCFCGENSFVGEVRTGCEFYGIEYEELENGFIQREMCDGCGAVRVVTSTVSNERVEEEHGCVADLNELVQFLKGEQIVYEYTYEGITEACDWEIENFTLQGESCEDGVEVEYVCAKCGNTWKQNLSDHEYVLEEVTDLSQYGLCVEQVIQYSCLCPEKHTHSEIIYGEDGPCNQGSVYDEETGEHLYESCEKCGAIHVYGEEITEKDDQCRVFYINSHTIMDAQQNELAVWLIRMTVNEHNWDSSKTTSVLLPGSDSCEDGTLFTSVCSDCGFESEQEINDHSWATLARYDLKDYGLCDTKVGFLSCGCGWSQEWYHDGECQFEQIDSDEHSATYQCVNCLVIYVHSSEAVSEEDPCYESSNHTYTFYKDGEVLFTGHISYSIDTHDVVTTSALREGAETCEDGVVITSRCANCDWQDTFTLYYHELVPVARYNLADYGLCGTQVVFYECACGQENRWDYYGDNVCQWEGIGGNESAELFRCTECGAMYEHRWEDTRVENTCFVIRTSTYTFSTEDGELFAESFQRRMQSHDMVTTYELMEGSNTCEDGVIQRMACKYCDYSYTHTYEGSPDWHFGIRTKGEMLGTLCSPVYVQTENCVCGQNGTRTYLSWEGEFCQFMEYDEAQGGHVCAGCGAVEQITHEFRPVEEDPCKRERITHSVYLRDGVELFRFDGSQIETNHDEYIVSFQLNGSTCDDGYTVTHGCWNCDYSFAPENQHYGCSTWVTGRETIYDGTGMCGPISMTDTRCACGAESNKMLSYDCNFQWDGWNEELQTHTYTCTECGASYYHLDSEELNEETCMREHRMTYTFTVGGVVLDNVTIIEETEEHEYLYTFTIGEGLTCTDGFSYVGECYRCHKTVEGSFEAGVITSHWTVCTARYDLADYGLCDTVVTLQSCPCGGWAYWEYGGPCNWNHIGGDENSNVFQCAYCGTEYVESWVRTPVAGTCDVNGQYTITFSKDDAELFTLSYSRVETQHDLTTSAVLVEGAETCEDGVRIVDSCTRCDYRSEYTEHYHRTVRTGYCDLAEHGLCDTRLEFYECACGREGYWQTLGTCQWEMMESDGDIRREQCSSCGVIREICNDDIKIDGTCAAHRTTTVTLSKDGTELFTHTIRRYVEIHDLVTTYTLLEGSDSCEDGFIEYKECVNCDYSWNHTYVGEEGWHPAWIESRELIGTLCGKVYRVTNTCPCGQESNSHLEWEQHCEFEHDPESNQLVCSICGAVRKPEHEELPVEGETCKVQIVTREIYSKDGVELFRHEDSYIENRHDTYAVSFQLFGETCDDGYTVNYGCYDCDYSEVTGTRYGCVTHTVGKQIIHDGSGICGEIYLENSRCACGAQTNESIRHRACSFEYSSWTEAGNVYTCSQCGSSYIRKDTYVLDEETCISTDTYVYTFTVNGVTLPSVTVVNQREEHKYVYTYTIGDGDTCFDGFDYYGVCCRCGDIHQGTWEPGELEDHWPMITAYYDLERYGVKCGGYFQEVSCPCGEQAWSDRSILCSLENRHYDQATGMYVETCSQCGAIWHSKEEGAMNGCNYVGYYIRKLVAADGTVLLTIKNPIDRIEHDYRPDFSSVTFNNSVDCEEGGTIIQVCARCGESFSSKFDDHQTYAVEKIYLDQMGACEGAYAEILRCPCGKEHREGDLTLCLDDVEEIHSYDESTNTHTYSKTCPICGLNRTFTNRFVYVPEDCKIYRYDQTVYSIDGVIVKEMPTWEYIDEDHSWVVHSAQLVTPGTSCEDGILVSYVCKYCGITGNSDTEYYHRDVVLDSIDLTQYGASCSGSTLVLKGCVCGHYTPWASLEHEDNQCASNKESCEMWVAGTFTDVAEGMEYNYGISNYADVYTCGMEGCNLMLRKAAYAIKTGCMVTSYESWQYFDGTNWLDLPGFAKIERDSCFDHDIVYGDGTYQVDPNCTVPGCTNHYVRTGTCADCKGVTFEYCSCMNVDGQCLFSREVHTNTTGNGECQSLIIEETYGQTRANGELLRTEEAKTRINAQGLKEEYRRVFEYSFTQAGCVCTEYVQDYDGSTRQDSYDYHCEQYQGQVEIEATCTQFGEVREVYVCLDCGTTRYYVLEILEPTQHTFVNGKCTGCDMEEGSNSNGTIILENMTTKHGNGTHTVIGYWNQAEGTDFTNTVEVAFGEQLVEIAELTFERWTVEENGICAVAVNTAELEAAIAEALGDYVGEYSYGITFYQNDLQYAIHFTKTKQ